MNYALRWKWLSAFMDTPHLENGTKAAAAVIEADREAVREQTVAKIVAWLRGDGESDWFDPDCADAIEAGEWK